MNNSEHEPCFVGASVHSPAMFGTVRIIRAARLTEFNTNDSCRVLLVSITAGGQGLDFTAASNVVFVELPKSPAWLRQAEDRLHRRRQVSFWGSFLKERLLRVTREYFLLVFVVLRHVFAFCTRSSCKT